MRLASLQQTLLEVVFGANRLADAVGLDRAEGAGLPVRSVAADEVERHLGWMAPFAAFDMIASSAWKRARLGWEPAGPDLLSDLAAMNYSALADG